jgi:hypothetical protein
VTFDEETALRAIIRTEMRGSITDTGLDKKYARPDWRSWIMVGLGILGAVAAFTMFVFKTNAAADLEHAQMQAETSLQGERISKHDAAQDKMLERLDTLNDNQIRIGERLRVRGLKGANDVDQ